MPDTLPASGEPSATTTPSAGPEKEAVAMTITSTVTADTNQRNALMITGNSGAADPSTVSTAAQFSAKRIAQINSDAKILRQQRSLFAKYGETFSGIASSTIHVDSIKTTKTGAEAQITETTYLHRTPDQNGEPRPDYGYDFPETVSFVNDNGVLKEDSVTHPPMEDAELPETVAPSAATVRSWNNGTAEKQYKRLVADLKKPQYMPPNTRSEDTLTKPSAAAGSGIAIQPASMSTTSNAIAPLAQPAVFKQWTFTSHANRAAVVQYALAHGTDRNWFWPSIPDDCTNFVSQALHAGGWQMTYNINNLDINYWYGLSWPVGLYNRSWENAEDLFEYGVYAKQQMQGANGTSSSFAPPGIVAGDIAFFIWNINDTTWSKANLWDHATVVTYVDSMGTPYFTEHTNDHVKKSQVSMLEDGS